MLKLCAFTDEISPNLDEQIAFCKKNAISHFELRGVNNKNVLDFDPALRNEIKTKLADNGLAVAIIGSPIGKVKINEPWSTHFDRFKIAVELAQFFNAPMIRLFSYYPEDGGDIKEHRDEVLRRFREKLNYIQNIPVTLAHENEAKIYGEKRDECVDLMQSFNSPKLRFAFDFGNFVQCGENPLNNWPALKPYTIHIHIKDALHSTNKMVPAGQGDGHLPEILRDAYASGYRGFLSLEPHLVAQGKLSGFSGPELFQQAVDALRKVCKENQIPLAEK
ncbi:MAG TPA: sugar phosphate isomerase/epimerase family protein [Tepidisphaeraceae bacterium]|jgi:sugar phosphate isomerase/epimerase